MIPFHNHSTPCPQEEARAAAASKGGREGGADGGDAAAETPLQPVSIRGIVGPRHGGLAAEAAPQLSEVRSVPTSFFL